MTREEILTMAPGRELDTISAEKVMEWHKVDLAPKGNGWFWSDGKSHVAWAMFSPSSDISEAWEVLKKVETEWAWDMNMHNSSNEVDVYIGKKSYTSMSVPEAICKAALLAVLDL